MSPSADQKLPTAREARICLVHVSDVCSLSREASQREPTRVFEDRSCTCKRHYSKERQNTETRLLPPNQLKGEREKKKRAAALLAKSAHIRTQKPAAVQNGTGIQTPVIVIILAMSRQFKKRCLGSHQNSGGSSQQIKRAKLHILALYATPSPFQQILSLSSN